MNIEPDVTQDEMQEILVLACKLRGQDRASEGSLARPRKATATGLRSWAVAAICISGFLAGAACLAGFQAAEESRKKLPTFESVVEAAAQLVDRPDGHLYLFLDVPAYGNASVPESYSLYLEAMKRRMNDAAKETEVMVYSEEDEKKYIRLDTKTEELRARILEQARVMRNVLAPAKVTEVPYGTAHNQQFWVWVGPNGECESVIAHVTKRSLKAEVSGFRSDSKDVKDLLVDIFESVKENKKNLERVTAG